VGPHACSTDRTDSIPHLSAPPLGEGKGTGRTDGQQLRMFREIDTGDWATRVSDDDDDDDADDGEYDKEDATDKKACKALAGGAFIVRSCPRASCAELRSRSLVCLRSPQGAVKGRWRAWL
jgi:hypothetical protein